MLDPNLATTEKLKRFKNEYNFCLRHPHTNIVGVSDSGIVEVNAASMPFFVMRYFAKSLRDLLKEKQLAPAAVLKTYDQILSGVEAAHLLKVVHRDLKPENILYDPSASTAVVADFGIAQFGVDDLFTVVETGPSDRLANFLYAAPEQRLKGRKVDHRADIYALGLILNELFTGEVPHGTGYRTIASIAPQYAYLDDLIAQMLRQAPDERPTSVVAIKEDLIARGQAFVELQRLDQLRQAVVPVSEISDPLIDNQVSLVGAHWNEGVLTLKLSQPVNSEWVDALQHMGGYRSMAHQPPQAFTFRGSEARVRAQPSDVQSIIDVFKEWLLRATEVYASRVRQVAQETEDRQRAELRSRIAAAEVRDQVNRSIKI